MVLKFTNKISVIAVVGATASGKSALAFKLAETLGGEIISGDSMQIYRGMDIGTAKPTREEQAAIPHHLIDIADITEAFSVADFITKASAAAKEIVSRGKVPIIVGGTGLYINLLLSGKTLSETETDEQLRRELYERADKEGNEALHEYLKKLDPVSAAVIHPNNVKRVVRAVEIFLSSGLTKTEQDERSRLTESIFNYKILYLSSKNRQFLYDRIDNRVDQMLENGLESEVRELYRAGLQETPTASQAIGYKEFFPYFQQKKEKKHVCDEIKQHTRNYAKRQMTYFSRMSDKVDFDISAESMDAIFEKALAFCDNIKRR